MAIAVLVAAGCAMATNPLHPGRAEIRTERVPSLGQILVDGRGRTPLPHLLRYLGVLPLFGIGSVHLHEYPANRYRGIPTIGARFALDFAGAVVLGLVLASPLRSLPGVRSVPVSGRAPHTLVALGAALFALGTVTGLLTSEQASLFGFHEYGYRSGIGLALEGAAVAVLLGFAALDLRRAQTRPSADAG
ncbi:hypothetical protein ACQEU6_06520 [Spirillospora sp. CA-108201]